jgi:flavin-dependent dehydrogenase
MQSCDVLVVGGGPAGSSCAWSLRRAGLDVRVLDRARFPRDKPCAGWVTPQALAALELDLEDYASARVLQPVRGLLTGRVRGPARVTRYPEVVSHGVRRCEFDDYLLRRSGARVLTEAVSSLRRESGGWVVNGELRAPIVVGAGGHFCPVARALGAGPGERPLVAAQEVELRLSAEQRRRCRIAGEVPELYFCGDLEGYGWAFLKQDHLNVGFGRRDVRGFPARLSEFWRFLVASGRVPEEAGPPWPGHAYLLYEGQGRRIVDDGVLLVGDAAGLAYPQSGEGIARAIESGLLAAAAILAAGSHRDRESFEPYRHALSARFGGRGARSASSLVPAPARAWLAGLLVGNAALSRHLVLDRWFLHRREPALGDPRAYLAA